MLKVIRLRAVLAMVVLLTVLSFAPGETTLVEAAVGPSTVIYNLYATDGYVGMADGTRMYMYGFVGGRQGEPVKYMTSAGTVAQPGGNWPAPTAGAPTAGETPFMGNAQFPAPLLWATTKDVVEIRLKNLGITLNTAPNDPHSIHLHGLDVDAANDGVPETSVGAVPANGTDPGAGNVIVYMFSQSQAGTYFYHCHQEADIHVQMGMYGGLVIYNPTDAAATSGLGPGRGQGGDLYGWKYDKDVIMLLSEIDVRQHVSEEGALADPRPGLPPGFTTPYVPADGFNPIDYKPQYWLINGLSFPNTVHADAGTGFNWTNWSAAYPNYDPFISGSATALSSAGTKGTKVLVRIMNMGFEAQPMHIHGFHPKVIGMDQRPWTWANAAPNSKEPGNQWGYKGTPPGKGMEMNTFGIFSGQAMDILIDFSQQAVAEKYAPNSNGFKTQFAGGTQSRYNPANNLPVSNTQTQFPVIPDPFNPGADYIGGPKVTGLVGHPDPTSQYFPWHNHDDYKATNNGAYPGGQFTLVRMDP